MEDINAVLPEGLIVLKLVAIDMKAASLQAFIKRYVYEVRGADASGTSGFIAKKQHIIDRKGKPLDIRPMLESVEELKGDGVVRVTLRDTKDKGVRLDEMCEALFGAQAVDLVIRRTAMYGQERGQWKRPLKDAAG